MFFVVYAFDPCMFKVSDCVHFHIWSVQKRWMKQWQWLLSISLYYWCCIFDPPDDSPSPFDFHAIRSDMFPQSACFDDIPHAINVGIAIINHPWLGMANIPTIYGDDWGMAYYCYTHIVVAPQWSHIPIKSPPIKTSHCRRRAESNRPSSHRHPPVETQ